MSPCALRMDDMEPVLARICFCSRSCCCCDIIWWLRPRSPPLVLGLLEGEGSEGRWSGGIMLLFLAPGTSRNLGLPLPGPPVGVITRPSRRSRGLPRQGRDDDGTRLEEAGAVVVGEAVPSSSGGAAATGGQGEQKRRGQGEPA